MLWMYDTRRMLILRVFLSEHINYVQVELQEEATLRWSPWKSSTSTWRVISMLLLLLTTWWLQPLRLGPSMRLPNQMRPCSSVWSQLSKARGLSARFSWVVCRYATCSTPSELTTVFVCLFMSYLCAHFFCCLEACTFSCHCLWIICIPCIS